MNQFSRISVTLFAFAMGQMGCLGEEDSAAERAKVRMFFKGMNLYESQCLPCHGQRGRGDGPWSEGLVPKPRDFHTGVFKFRTTAYGKLPTDDDLRRTIRAGISGTAMPTFKSLSDGDVDSLIAYIKSFSRQWNDKLRQAEALSLPKSPDWFGDEKSFSEHAKAGKAKFAVTCASCHGPEGKGDGPAAKGLIDLWKNPIIPADLSLGHHKSGDTPTDLYRTIATGLDGTPMLGFASVLKEGEVWELVAFIKSIEIKAPKADP